MQLTVPTTRLELTTHQLCLLPWISIAPSFEHPITERGDRYKQGANYFRLDIHVPMVN